MNLFGRIVALEREKRLKAVGALNKIGESLHSFIYEN